MKTRVLGIILAFAGLSIIAYGLYIRYETLNTQQRIIQQFENVMQETVETDIGQANSGDPDSMEQISMVQQHADDPLLKIEGIDVIGIMEIPKIDLKVAVAEGTDKKTLKKAVGHFDGTAMPGETGNFAVAGHRSYTYNEFFNRLNEMEIGDEIRVRTVKGEFVYEVTDIFVVEPHDVWVLDPTPDPTITLVTCTPIRVATHRLIVKGKLKS